MAVAGLPQGEWAFGFAADTGASSTGNERVRPMSNKLSFLDDKNENAVVDKPNVSDPVTTQDAEPASVAASPDPAPASQPDQAAIDAKARDDAGRERDPETGKFVPPGLLEERRRRQAAEAEARELREYKQRMEQERQQQQYQPPLVTEDAEGWAQHVEQQQAFTAYNQKLDTSEMLVRQQFGDEVVDKAADAFLEARQADPTLQQKFDSQKHPYAWVLNWHKQHQLLSEIGSDPEAWRNAERERIRQELLASQKPASVAQPSAPSYQPPPPSLASAPVAARPNAAPHVGPGQAFDRAIPR